MPGLPDPVWNKLCLRRLVIREAPGLDGRFEIEGRPTCGTRAVTKCMKNKREGPGDSRPAPGEHAME